MNTNAHITNLIHNLHRKNYSVASNVRKIPGALDKIFSENKKIESVCDGFFAVYTKDYTNQLACYTYKPSKNNTVNKFFQVFPSIKVALSEARKLFSKHNKHGEYYSIEQLKQSASDLAENSKLDYHEMMTNLSKKR